MLAFRPAQASFLQNFLSDFRQQGALLFVILIALFMFIHVRRASNRIAKLTDAQSTFASIADDEGSPDFTKKNDLPAPKQIAGATAPAPNNFSAQNTSQAAPAAATQPAAAVVTAAKETKAAPAVAPLPKKIRVGFLMVQKSTLAAWLGDARDVTSYGSFTAGVVGDGMGKLTSAGDTARPIDSPLSQAIKLNQVIVINKGVSDPLIKQPVGLSLQVMPATVDDTGTQVNVSVSRTFREPIGTSPPYSQLTFPPQQFLIPKSGMAFLAGTLLHRPLADDEAALYRPINVLKVMTADAYLAGTAEFVILIEPR